MPTHNDKSNPRARNTQFSGKQMKGMKIMKKTLAILLALVMVMSLATTAFAQEVGTKTDGTGSITISNASKGETYKIFKLFDASINADGSSVVYTGTIPDSLTSVFTKNAAGNIVVVEGKTDEEVTSAVQAWAATQTDPVAEAESDGSALTFQGLAYGYYAITTTQGSVVSVDSTNPNATVFDKNSGTPTLTKDVDDDDVYIGQTVTYTVEYTAYNYNGQGENAKQIVSYTIEDTLPDFLTDVEVTSITINGEAYTVDEEVPQFENKKITIPWAENGTSLYENGATIKITYTAVVTENAVIGGNGNTNKVTLTWEDTDGPDDDKLEAEETIYTYAIAVKKVNEKGENLAGATFQLPFYVNATADEDGYYVYAGTTAGEGLTNTLTSPADGVIVIKGVASGDYKITETSAPSGYNKVNSEITVTAEKTTETTTRTTWYIDKDGNVVETSSETTTEVTLELTDIAVGATVVVNKSGTELPSTGGMGTTLFYVFGSLMVVGAAILLVTKKRMSAAE